MFRLQNIILTALVAAFVPLNAWSFPLWTVQFFSDSTCDSLITLESAIGNETCATIGGLATALSFTPDELQAFDVQLFTDLNCETLFFQSATAATCSPIPGDGAQSFSISPAPSFEDPGADFPDPTA